MKTRIFTLVFVAALMITGAVAMMAQDQAAAPAAEPAAKKPVKHAAMAQAVKPETLSGTLSMVDASKMMVVVTASNVPYNFTVSRGTKITVGGTKAKLADLSGDTNKQATVTFMAERKKGNIAKSIEVTQ